MLKFPKLYPKDNPKLHFTEFILQRSFHGTCPLVKAYRTWL